MSDDNDKAQDDNPEDRNSVDRSVQDNEPLNRRPRDRQPTPDRPGTPSTQPASTTGNAPATAAGIPASGNLPPGVLLPQRRRVKRFNRIPAAAAVAILVVIVCGLSYVFLLTQGALKQKAQREVQEGHTADIAAIMSKAPAGGVIPAASEQAAPTGNVGEMALTPIPLRSLPEPGMTHAEIEGRRQLWTSYFQALNSAQQKHLDASYDALSADTQTTSAAAPGNHPGTAQGGGGAEQPGIETGGGGQSAHGPLLAGGGGQTSFFDEVGATPETDYLPATVTDPISPYEIKAVDIIEARMISGLTSDSHGVVRAVVSKNVYDHATGMHILIPQGSQLKGIYNTSVSYGQKRVEVAWQRVIYPAPCDQSLDLGQMPGSDQSGYSGFHDLTDNHYEQIFLNALLLSAFSAASQVSQGSNYSAFGVQNSGQIAAGAVGQQLSTLGEEFARRGLDIPPTEKVRNGYPFTIMVTRDIAFAEPWTAGRCGGQEMSVAER